MKADERMQGPLHFGVDVGGTFTDVVLLSNHERWSCKTLTDARDWCRSVLTGCESVARAAGLSFDDALGRATRFGLGTTAITNTLATRSGRRVGLITTEGFDATVPFHRGHVEVIDGLCAAPAEIVSPEQIAGVPERIDARGEIVIPLDEAMLLVEAKRLVEEVGVEARFPGIEDPNWAIPHCAYIEAEARGKGREFALAVFDARFGRGADVADAAALAEVAESVGLKTAPIVEAGLSELNQVALESQIQRDYDEEGIFGVPTLILPRGTRYWGHDRIEWAIREGKIPG